MGFAVAKDQEFTLPPLEERPLVTFALFAYNQEKYIREAVEGAFAQTYEPLEIILSDDCSTDRTFEIMEEMAAQYAGPHRIILRRPQSNLGLARGISEVCRMASGGLIVAAAGDDISMPERTEVMVGAWKKYGMKSGSIYTHFRTIDEKGSIWPPVSRCQESHITLQDRQLCMLNNFSGLSGCAHAWTRDLFEVFGPIEDRIDHEDVIIPLRALLVGGITFIPLDMVNYRLSQGSITRKTFLSSKERFIKMGRYWEGRVAVFQQLKSDAKLAFENNLVKKSDLEWLRNKAKFAEQHALAMHKFCVSGSSIRLKIVFSHLNTFTVKQRVKLFLLAISPWLYRFKWPRQIM